MMALSLQ